MEYGCTDIAAFVPDVHKFENLKNTTKNKHLAALTTRAAARIGRVSAQTMFSECGYSRMFAELSFA